MDLVAGCSGYRYYHPPADWKERYDQKIQAYADQFPLIEINSTFYRLPRVSTAEKWRNLVDKVNTDFIFTVKANQRITHPPSSPTYEKADLDISNDKTDKYGYLRHTEEVFSAWKETKEICEALKADICLFQTPASFNPSEHHLENLKRFFTNIQADFKLAFEPRGEEWNRNLLKQALENEIIHVVDPLKQQPIATNKWNYFRLHGLGDRKYKYKFSNDDLKKLYQKCMKFSKKQTYVLFNNYEMFADCQRFLTFIKTGEFPKVAWGANAVVKEIDVEYPTTKKQILSECGRWWVWIKPRKSIRVREALKPVKKERFGDQRELLASIASANPELEKSK